MWADNIVAGMASGRVRAMLNDRGERVKEAGPSMPVEIAGFTEVPEAGDDMMAVADDRLSRQVAQERREKMRAAAPLPPRYRWITCLITSTRVS